MKERKSSISAQQKALQINLDETKYGTFVEIGAGQEVARQFFSAGAAAGTVAKTMSAYDMTISDEIYGKASAYVSRERLEQMLCREFELLSERLADSRPKTTQFFSYAATVTARSFKQKNECHGWLGIQLQLYPEAPPSQIVLHVRMLDDDNKSQSEALGLLGVNLIYGAFYNKSRPKELIESLLDNIDSDRLEIDLIHFKGPYFTETDNRLMNLHLVRSWCCRAVMFDTEGASVVPASAMRKKDVMVMRGSFNPPMKLHLDMTESATQQLEKMGGLSQRGLLNVAEITMSELSSDGETDDANFLARVDLLVSMGYNVLISDYLRFFRLRSWIRNFTSNRIAVILSVHDLDKIFDVKYYEGMEGGILVALGLLFSDDTKVFVYPSKIDGELTTLEGAKISDSEHHLLQHLICNERIVALEKYNPDHLYASPKELSTEIRKGHGEWENYVTKNVVDAVVQKKLFGFGG